MHSKKGQICMDVTGFIQQLAAAVALRNNNNKKKS
jgi:hypothetical protein